MAVGDVSENPSGNAVTRPTITEIRDRDIENKLRIYGIFTAFSNGAWSSSKFRADSVGKFPSNKQIDIALTSVVESKMLTNPSNRLSAEGRQLVKDLRDVINSAKWLCLKKNYNEELQNFLYFTIQASATPDASNINAPVSQDTTKDHGNQALDGLRTLGRLLVTNGQFRKLLEDMSLLLRDMAADGASRATQKIRPDQERLDKIDEPAPDHTWYEAPPSVREMKESMKSQFRSAQDQTQQASGIVNDASHSATGQSDAQEAGGPAADENANQSPHDDIDQTRDAAYNTKSQIKNYLKRKILPHERRDKTIYRLKKMVIEIQRHEDYREATDTLIALTEEYVRYAKSVAGDTSREAKRSANDTNVQKAQAQLKTLLENLADGASMDDMFDAANDLIADANNDEEFNNWGKSVDKYIRKCLQEDGFILKDEATEEWNRLSDQGHYLLNDRYKQHTDHLNDEINRWFGYMTNDPDSVDFGNKVQKLFVDLGQDKNGNIIFKKHLLADVTEVIIPGFFEHLRYVPVCPSTILVADCRSHVLKSAMSSLMRSLRISWSNLRI
jgi:hypothetical protein